MRIYRKKIERITIIGPKDEIRKAADYISDNGYRFVWGGPKLIGRWKKDFTKFRFVAEREIRA